MKDYRTMQLTKQVARQAKVVRHKGQKGHNRSNVSNYERVMRWKLEAAKLKKMIKEKKKEYWERFIEEYGEEDPWQVVGFAKDPWRLKATMGSKIVGDEGQELETDEDKANHLALRNFKWAEEAMVEEEEEEVEMRHWD